jgi:hypothetical protein
MAVRLMARWWASLTRVVAKSSRLQRVAGRSCSSVLLVARVMTAVSSSGGKGPGPSGAWGVLQAGEAGGYEAFSPQADGVSIAVKFGGDVLVGGLVVLGSPEDEATAEGECLGRGASLSQGLELSAVLVGECDE